MKILQIITSLRTGGAERVVVDLAKQFRESGDDVAILLLDGTRTPMLEEAETAGIEVQALSKGWRAMRNPLLFFPLLRHLRRNRYEVVHTHNTACQMLVALASCIVPLHLVTTEHNTDNRRRRWRGFQAVDRWMYRRYRQIVCVSEAARTALAAYLADPALSNRMTVIPNGIDIQRFASALPAPDLLRQSGHKVLMVSAFRPQKDQQTLIRAIRQLPDDYLLYLAGGSETDEDRRQLADCERLVTDLGLRERVSFLGIRRDVPQLLAGADVVVLSTHYEGMPLSVLEAMASGRPFVASDVSGVHELVHGAGLLFPDGDVSCLANLLRTICETPGFSDEIRTNCACRARAFNVAETAFRYKKNYYI